MLIEHVRRLAGTIGPRPSATRREWEAAMYVAEKLEALGCVTGTKTFRALATYSWLHVTHYVLFLAAWALYFHAPWVSLALSAVGLASYWRELCVRPGLGSLFPKLRGTNAVGRLAPENEPRCKVMVAAHLDSSRSALLFHPKLVKGFRQSFVLTVSAVSVTCAGAVVFAAGWQPVWLWVLVGVLDLNLALGVALLIDREVRGRYTPGATDNASGVAAMLGAAQTLDGEKLKYTEVEFVGTGAEESGLFGMTHHLDHNTPDRDATFIINIDHVGQGELSVTRREGMLCRKNTDARLLEWAGEFSLPSSGKPAQEIDFHTMLTDGYAALMKGYNAISIMAFLPGGGLADWHWHTDVPEHVSEENLQDAAALAVHLIKKIDEHAHQRESGRRDTV